MNFEIRSDKTRQNPTLFEFSLVNANIYFFMQGLAGNEDAFRPRDFSIFGIFFFWLRRIVKTGCDVWRLRATPAIVATLRVTPAMEAGLTDHLWELEELLKLID